MLTDTRRRFLADCLDVQVLCEWGKGFCLAGGIVANVVMGVLMFRHFNRLSTWEYIVQAFEVNRNSPDFDALTSELELAEEPLHKPFAVPVTVRDKNGVRIGRTKVENAVWAFRQIWEHDAFKKLARILSGGVTTVESFVEVAQQWESLHESFPGAFGIYRFKNNMDVWLEMGMMSKHCVNRWPVAKKSGTWKSLKWLYGTRHLSELQAEELLVHLWHALRKRGWCKSRSDSLSVLSLLLCGWHRSKYRCRFQGKRMSGLDRAILREELDTARLRQALRTIIE